MNQKKKKKTKQKQKRLVAPIFKLLFGIIHSLQ